MFIICVYRIAYYELKYKLTYESAQTCRAIILGSTDALPPLTQAPNFQTPKLTPVTYLVLPKIVWMQPLLSSPSDLKTSANLS